MGAEWTLKFLGGHGPSSSDAYGIIAHMLSTPHLLCGFGPDGLWNYLVTYQGGYESIEDYIEKTGMANNETWGTDFEMTVFAHLLNSYHCLFLQFMTILGSMFYTWHWQEVTRKCYL